MNIVLDTHIVVSGLLQSQGTPAQVLTLVLSGAIQVCHDERILAEYAEVLSRPRFKFDPQRVREVLTKLEMDGLPINATGQRDLNLPDADDEPFLARLSILGGAWLLKCLKARTRVKKVCTKGYSLSNWPFWVMRGGGWGGSSHSNWARIILWSFSGCV